MCKDGELQSKNLGVPTIQILTSVLNMPVILGCLWAFVTSYLAIVEENDFHSCFALEIIVSNHIKFYFVFQQGLRAYTKTIHKFDLTGVDKHLTFLSYSDVFRAVSLNHFKTVSNRKYTGRKRIVPSCQEWKFKWFSVKIKKVLSENVRKVRFRKNRSFILQCVIG